MNRRTFVRKSGTIAMLSPALTAFQTEYASSSYLHFQSPEKPSWLLKLIKLNDQQIKNILHNRVSDTSNPSFGGIMNIYNIPNSQGTAYFVRNAICGITTPESEFFHDKDLMIKVNDAVLFLLKVQHEDGTIDLHTTNFHSTPDTAFIVKRLGPAFNILLKSNAPGHNDVLKNLQMFMQNAGKALVSGGIHTPNHRWVVCAGLAWLNILWPDSKYQKRAETWLAEGIDMDPDGQYNERSTWGYTPMTNRTLIIIARGFNKPELLDYVRRNLEMTMYHVHPNGEVVTEAARRGRGSFIGTLHGYYHPYRFMAHYDNNGKFTDMCRIIEETAFQSTVSQLNYLLEDISLWKELPPIESIPTHYERTFPHSGLVRIRRENYDASIISGYPVFFTFHKGNAVLEAVRVAAAFFGKGQFTTDEILKEGDTYILKRELRGPYLQPLDEQDIPGDGDWAKMPHSKREQSEIQFFETKVSIREAKNGFELSIDISGTDKVPVSVELIFRPEGTFSGVEPHDSMNEAYFFKKDYGSYTLGKNTISFGPGAYAHKWVQLRGALPKMNAPTVFLTGFTPFHQKINIS